MSENNLENQTTISEKNNVQLEDNLTKPMGVFNYIGTLILFFIPILGLFFALVWSFAPVNKNRKNLARAILVLKLICILLLVLFYFIIIPKFVTPFLDTLYVEFINQFTNSENTNELLNSLQDTNVNNYINELENFDINTINLNEFDWNRLQDLF